jgi:hypothetical protein
MRTEEIAQIKQTLTGAEFQCFVASRAPELLAPAS